MRILALETSCDETSAALIEASGGASAPLFTVLSSVIHSQIDIHRPYGGVYPTLAKREHQRNISPVIEKVFDDSGLLPKDIDAVAVTIGPGLEPALWVGIEAAKKCAAEWQLSLIPANHMEGHLVSVLLPPAGGQKNIEFPAIGLLVSGGHTELVLMRGWGQYEVIGRTRDDAAGEAFDKVARSMGLPYPGGPELSHLAQKYSHKKFPEVTLPRPMMHSNDYDFSFSGLKTAVLYMTRQRPELLTDETLRTELAHEFESAVVDVLIAKTSRALQSYGAQSLIVGGGVIANTRLREACETLAHRNEIPLFLPEKEYTGDNAAMIAAAAYLAHERGFAHVPMEANGILSL